MDYTRKTLLGSRLLSEEELALLEADNPTGLSSAQIVEVFTSRGIKFSEASFRKYVQLGLLPRSRRVGSKGKHKGSRGLYPPGTIRQINEIKRLMTLDYTIEEIRQQFAFVGGELEELRRLLERILEKLEISATAEQRGGLAAESARRRLEEIRQSARELMERLEQTAQRIRERAQIARDAV
jgi:DNA-binding transcriptional MerR regulator